MNVTIQFEADAFIDSLAEFQSQAAYILQKSVNETLIGAQSDMLQSVNDKFTIRRPAFAKRSFKMVKFATKSDLSATLAVSSINGRDTTDIFAKFERGDRKVSHGGSIAVPTTFIRPDKSRIITSTKRPRNLPNAFKITTSKGTTLLIQPKGKGKRSRTEVAYVLKTSVNTPRKLGFEERTTAYITQHLQQNVERWTDQALTTARLK